MQFIDQAPAYKTKSISLAQAIKSGRAKLTAEDGSEKLLASFRPELTVATAFDSQIDGRLRFNDLSTAEKLDLLIADLLPGFFHAELLPDTGRDNWAARFIIDGTVSRTVQIDADGVRSTQAADITPAFELETDIMTLMAILRSVIAEFHLQRLDLQKLGLNNVGSDT